MNTSSSSSSLRMWDNAAFVEDSSAGPGLLGSYLPLQPISFNIADGPIKENRSPRSKKPAGAGDIDAEIAEIESEISRLSKKLEALKIKRAQTLAGPAKTPAQKRGRIVPAKFLNLETPPPPPASSKKIPIQESRRRGLSLGPMEIYNNTTPLRAQKPPASFQKLEGIKEKVKSKGKDSAMSARSRGMSLGPSEILRQRSSSPKARKPMNSRVSELRKGVSTVGAKNLSAKMDEGSVSRIKPKTLFQEKKRPAAKVRAVASRYNEVGSKRRKWSLPEAEGSGAKGKKRAFSLGGANVDRLKAEAEAKEEERSPPPSIMKIAEGLQKIRTSRGEAIESPRDSGAAKRVAELVGRKMCFADDGSVSPWRSLSFED